MLPPTDMNPGKPIIGRREWLRLPDLGILGIEAKTDTGARTSALHTHDYETFLHEDGSEWVRFHLHPLTSTDDIMLTCEAPVLDFRDVKDSSGNAERRPFIESRAVMGDHEWSITLSLTNREGMKYRMLLGRVAIAGHFLVDCQKTHIQSDNLSSEYEVEKL